MEEAAQGRDGRGEWAPVSRTTTSSGIARSTASSSSRVRNWRSRFTSPLTPTTGARGTADWVLAHPAAIDRVLDDRVQEAQDVADRLRREAIGEHRRRERLRHERSSGHRPPARQHAARRGRAAWTRSPPGTRDERRQGGAPAAANHQPRRPWACVPHGQAWARAPPCPVGAETPARPVRVLGHRSRRALRIGPILRFSWRPSSVRQRP